jgi:hypothetical protein
MNSLFNFVEELEKLAYKILLWIILIPKTLLQVLLFPRWARLYVKNELRKDKESPFDEYISPVILLLVVALLPALLINSIPEYGINVINPPPGTFTDSASINFDAQANFILNTQGPWHRFTWTVDKIEVAEDNSYQNKTQPLVNEVHDESRSNFFLDRKMLFVEGNSVQDHFQYKFEQAGGYLVNVTAENFIVEADGQETIVESYPIENFLFLHVPNRDGKIEYDPEIDGEINISLLDFKQQTNLSRPKSTSEFLQSQNTILLALLLMIPPLFFGWVTRFRVGQPLGQNALKESFYIQCYYFAPMILSVWAIYVYYEISVFQIILPEGFYNEMFMSWFMPITLILIWFIAVETYVISREREKTGRLKAFFITLGCLIVIYTAWSLYEGFIYSPISQRLEYGLKSYPALVWFVILLFVTLRIWNFIKRRRANRLTNPIEVMR